MYLNLPVVQFHGVPDCRGMLHYLLLRLNMFHQPRLPNKPYCSHSQSAISFTKNAMFRVRTKHIDVQYDFLVEIL